MSVSQSSNNFVVRLRGLPWNTSQNEIRNFLQGCKIDHVQFLTDEQGRDLGECFVVTESREDLELAKSFDKKVMSNRYIEIFDSSTEEMRHLMRKNCPIDTSGDSTHDKWREPVVRLRGLPYNSTKSSVIEFFKGLHIAQNGVHISASKPAGEAFVAFTNMDNAFRALEYNRKNMGHRYIEVFKSHYAEARASIFNDSQFSGSQNYRNNSEHYENRSENTQNCNYTQNHGNDTDSYHNTQLEDDYALHGADTNNYSSDNFMNASTKRPFSSCFMIEMRGVPFEAGRNDILEFFYPVVPIELEQRENHRSRAPIWYAEFGSREEATEAMTFHQKNMGKRYIELFPLFDFINRSKMVRT